MFSLLLTANGTKKDAPEVNGVSLLYLVQQQQPAFINTANLLYLVPKPDPAYVSGASLLYLVKEPA